MLTQRNKFCDWGGGVLGTLFLSPFKKIINLLFASALALTCSGQYCSSSDMDQTRGFSPYRFSY